MTTFTYIHEPHPDIEHGFSRRPLVSYLTLPEEGLGANTGIIFFIGGYGSLPNSEYAAKLRSYLSNQYNCLAATVGYFGQEMKNRGTLVPAPDFFINLMRYHGVSVSAPHGMNRAVMFNRIADELVNGGIAELHPSCRLICESGTEYQSFGLLPAIDHLQVLNYMINNYSVSRKRIYVIGTSYGGYVALLMGKLAPGTFRLIVDNSGFVRPNGDVYGDSHSRGSIITQYGNLTVSRYEPIMWSKNPLSPRYFSLKHALIRTLLITEHQIPTTTHYFCCHWVGDIVAPFAEKACFIESMKKITYVEFLPVTEANIDGSLFKELIHGLKSSLRLLFDRAYATYLAVGGADDEIDTTDFDICSRYVFKCNECSYIFSYSRETGVSVVLAGQS